MQPAGRSPDLAEESPRSRQVELGPIVGCHGVRGEVRVFLHNPDSALVQNLRSVQLSDRDHTVVEYRVRAARPHKRFVLLQLDGVETRSDAEALVGRCVIVPREALPPPGPEEFYHADLVGCEVRTEAGKRLGRVSRMIVTGSNDVCVVSDRGREILIPLIEDVIVSLDIESAEIVVRLLPGLLD